jgi:hypothetical protein
MGHMDSEVIKNGVGIRWCQHSNKWCHHSSECYVGTAALILQRLCVDGHHPEASASGSAGRLQLLLVRLAALLPCTAVNPLSCQPAPWPIALRCFVLQLLVGLHCNQPFNP